MSKYMFLCGYCCGKTLGGISWTSFGFVGASLCFGVMVGQLALERVKLNAIWQQVDSHELA